MKNISILGATGSIGTQTLDVIRNSEGKIKVKNLSQHFNVTEDCIRKDLKQLENLGHLKRNYSKFFS